MDAAAAPASRAKRKRAPQDETGGAEAREAGGDAAAGPSEDARTPKRGRPSLPPAADASSSEYATSDGQRGLRRTRKRGNLSQLSLRHAAARQSPAAPAQEPAPPARESKFHEGSLTDKPSAQPPSVFTRVVGAAGPGLIPPHDRLMDDYYDGGGASASDSADAAVRPEGAAAEAAEKRDDTGGSFFRRGKHLAAIFHPVALWNKLYSETKEDLTRQNMEAALRRRQKHEAEARYAQMKRAGQLGLQPVGLRAADARELGASGGTPRDSGVVVGGGGGSSARSSSDEHARAAASPPRQLLPPAPDDFSSASGGDGPDTASRPKPPPRSRWSFARPSISNLKDGLKRVKSDFNLAAAATATPVAASAPPPALTLTAGAGPRESSSSVSPAKVDFDRSTLRKSASRYDLKKQNRLSKRVSDLEAKLQQARRELDEALVEASPMPKRHHTFERFTPQRAVKRPKGPLGTTPTLPSEHVLMAQEGFGDDEESPAKIDAASRPAPGVSAATDGGDDDETLRAPRRRRYPPRAVSLFDLRSKSVENASSAADHIGEPSAPADDTGAHAQGATTATPSDVIQPAQPNGRKRKSSVDNDDELLQPDAAPAGEDDGAASSVASESPRKKRKSNGNKDERSPRTKRARSGAAKPSSPPGGQTKGPAKKAGKAAAHNADHTPHSPGNDGDGAVADPDELADAPAARSSLDSQGPPLEPLYEEEEETTTVPLKDVPSKPTAQATPARYGRRVARSRSTSPHKRSGTVTVVPGEGDVPALPTNGVTNKATENYQWPEDCF